tara:strand:- start:3216 stop:4040 length:825 start_codon:yes stop_codon:yes gene_type:complete
MSNETILSKSLNRAFRGGVSGFSAMCVQVTSLMWLRTIMNFQYRHGGTIKNSISTLYKDGGVLRFYRGYAAAISIGPLSRFGDTAANSFAISLCDDSTPTAIKTLSGSALASSWRIFLMPIDALKTNLQVNGNLQGLKNNIKVNGIKSVYNGTTASMTATFVGHYPWFLTYNILSEKIPEQDTVAKTLMRNATIGFTSSVVSDCVSNSLRVVKTVKQTNNNKSSYKNIITAIIEKDGIHSLLGRGLKTRILTNAVQGMMFTVCWKYFENKLSTT